MPRTIDKIFVPPPHHFEQPMGKTKAGTHPNVPSKREVRTTCYPEFPTRRPGEIPNPNTVDYLPNGRYPKEEQREDEYTSGVLDFNTLQKQKDQLELEVRSPPPPRPAALEAHRAIAPAEIREIPGRASRAGNRGGQPKLVCATLSVPSAESCCHLCSTSRGLSRRN